MDDPLPKRRFSTRGFTSLILACSLIVMGVSGTILYLAPRGRDAHWTDWSLFGLAKEQWAAVHINNSILFLIVAVVHLVLNWTIFWSYVKKRAALAVNLKRELALSAAVAGLFVGGTLYGLPPFSTVMDWNTAIKEYWGRLPVSAVAPVAHGEELTLAAFAARIDLSAEEAAEALRQEGFDVEDLSATIREIAVAHGIPPAEVLTAIRKHYPQAGHSQGGGLRSGRGMGMGIGRGQGAGMGRGPGFGSRRARELDAECDWEEDPDHKPRTDE